MLFLCLFSRIRTNLPLIALAICAGTPVAAHEAWLLTPAEIEQLATAPVPPLFTSWLWLGLAALLGACVTGIALWAEDILCPYEERWCRPLVERALSLGGLALRLSLATMLALAGLGGLPRSGTMLWAEPTFLVPDMQLSLFPGWDWLATAQIGLAIILATGFFSRVAGLAVVALAGLGLVIAGPTFAAYAPHFAAPGLMLVLVGGGAMSLDHWFAPDDSTAIKPQVRQFGWRMAQVLIGGGFIYLAIAYKLTQPTLLIAILEHGNLPAFGMPLPVLALLMTGVEIICGALLIVGRLTRPVALVIILAITTLAIGLGETPLFHANLYGVMVFFVLAGRRLPEPNPVIVPLLRIAV